MNTDFSSQKKHPKTLTFIGVLNNLYSNFISSVSVWTKRFTCRGHKHTRTHTVPCNSTAATILTVRRTVSMHTFTQYLPLPFIPLLILTLLARGVPIPKLHTLFLLYKLQLYDSLIRSSLACMGMYSRISITLLANVL